MSSVLDEVKELKKSGASPIENEKAKQLPTENEPQKVEVPTMTAQEGLNKMIGKKVEEEKDMKSLAKDLTYLAKAGELQKDEEFSKAYSEELGKQLVESLKNEGKRQAISDAAKKQAEKNIRATAFYEGCKPIFELLGIQEAYGLIPMMITVVLLMAPFLIVSLIRFDINSVNSIFTAISGFKKPAFWLCSIVVSITITALVVLAALWGVDKVFGTNIIG